MTSAQDSAPAGLRIDVDRNVCVGNASCVEIAPAAFELDEDMQSVVKPGAATAIDEETILHVATNCPSSAITLSDARTGKQIFP